MNDVDTRADADEETVEDIIDAVIENKADGGDAIGDEIEPDAMPNCSADPVGVSTKIIFLPSSSFLSGISLKFHAFSHHQHVPTFTHADHLRYEYGPVQISVHCERPQAIL